MKVIATVLARDEIDVIDAMIRYHLAHGVDAIVATDNGSVDGTRDVLASYERSGTLHLLDEAPGDFSQHRWVSRMANFAYQELSADWLIHADADELFVTTTGASLRDVLSNVDPSLSVLRVSRHDFVPVTLTSAAPPQAQMVYRKKMSLNMRGNPLPPKVIHRGAANCVVAQGNHHVHGYGLGDAVDYSEIEVLHYPIRSYVQFESKVRNGGSGYARNTRLPEGIGFHKRTWYAALEEGKLRSHYDDYFYSPARLSAERRTGDVVLDRRASAFFSESGS